MVQVKLDASFCKAVRPKHKTVEYADEERAYKGLRLVVTAAGDKAFAFRSNPYYATIGTYPGCSLSYARKQVADWKLQLKAGKNPFDDLKAAKQAARAPVFSTIPTLQELWDEYDNEFLTTKSDKHRINANRSMRKHFLPVFGKQPFNEVSGRELHAFRIQHQKKRLREMEQMKAYLSGMVSWMRQHEVYQAADYMANPPQFGRVERDRRTNSGVRYRKHTREEDIRAYWRALREHAGPRYTMLALQLLFLTCKRGAEVQRMTPDQVDFERQVWTIPAYASKNNREIEQPLTPLMIEIIQAALGNRTNGFVFSNTMGEKQVMLASTKLHRAICQEAGTDYISTHDYRRTITTGLEELGVPARVLKLIKGHYDKGIEEHYAQAEKRPRDEQLVAYQKWEEFIAGTVGNYIS